MSRLHLALQRSRSSEPVADAHHPEPGPKFVVQNKESHPGPHPVSATPPASVPRGISCPTCQRSQRPPKAWMLKVFGVLHIRPYRCRFCRRRFDDVSALEAQAAARRQALVVSGFLRPDDDLGFQDLIEKIARAEQETGKSKPA